MATQQKLMALMNHFHVELKGEPLTTNRANNDDFGFNNPKKKVMYKKILPTHIWETSSNEDRGVEDKAYETVKMIEISPNIFLSSQNIRWTKK